MFLLPLFLIHEKSLRDLWIFFGDMNEAPIEDQRVEKLTYDVRDFLYDLFYVYVAEANLGKKCWSFSRI